MKAVAMCIGVALGVLGVVKLFEPSELEEQWMWDMPPITIKQPEPVVRPEPIEPIILDVTATVSIRE